ncbi:MAG: thioredoxin family protein [Pelagibacteraceae bacterium]|tara:strand:+ start:747 stop:1064 length:318 start_codon:yes stop_codon:yes gene_type:complete
MAFKDSTDEKFQEQINSSKLTLIQFSASWCNPCQILKPIVLKISNDLSDKIDCYYHDIESQPNKPVEFSVRGVPTIILCKNGKHLATKVGASNESDLLEFIKPHL